MPRYSALALGAVAFTVCTIAAPVAGALGQQSAQVKQFTRVYLPQPEGDNGDGPACLDGSPPVLYFRPGDGDGANKWVVYHQGGGWCTSHEDCAGRARGNLGSSKNYPPTIGDNGFLSRDKAVAPGWHNWNQVHMQYCDGASFSGNLDGTVVVNKDTELYYRGHRNLKAMMTWALANGLESGTDMIVSGGSAGGLATFLHAAEWCHVFEANSLYSGGAYLSGGGQKKRCVAIPDAGFFPDIQFTDDSETTDDSVTTRQDEDDGAELLGGELLGSGKPGNYGSELRWVYDAQNVTVNHMCQAHLKGHDAGKCMFAEHTAPFVSQPILVLNSMYDSWQISRELPSSHSEQDVNKLGRVMIDRITETVLKVNPKSAAWLSACSEHTVTPKWMTAGVDGMRAPDVMAQWYAGLDDEKAKTSWIAGDKYPCASCCSNFKPSEQERESFVLVEEAAIE